MSNYYNIILSYEIPINVLDSQDINVITARDILYENIKNILPDKYEKFSIKLVLHQLKDTLNYLVTYESYFRSTSGLPMGEYVDAMKLKEDINAEFAEFFLSIDCEFKQINIKTLV